MSLIKVKKELRKYASLEKARILQGFFKTGKGEYAEGDIFIGVVVPKTRLVAGNFSSLPLKDVISLLRSSIHEERLLSLLILIEQFSLSDELGREKIYRLYLKNSKYINNWDLVDLSARQIVGAFLWDKDKSILYRLARSKMLWERRIAILAAFYFINKKSFSEAFKLSKMLIADKHDLMHKAVGWMLREIGKRDLSSEIRFLNKHYKEMPRTMLRYAIERFPEKLRQSYLKGTQFC